jgi:hypothetical protein
VIAQLIISVLVATGAVWIILAPTGRPETDGAIALLSFIASAWLTRVYNART